MALSDLTNETLDAIFKVLVLEIGVRKALLLRGVCRQFAYTIEVAIFNLPTFEDQDDLCPANCRQDPRMHKAITSRLIIHKLGKKGRSLIQEIQSTTRFLEQYCQITGTELSRALAAACSDALSIRDISRGLAPGSSEVTSQTLSENALVAAVYLNDRDLCVAMLRLGARPTKLTRFFGDPISMAARKGRSHIMRDMLDHSGTSESTTAAQLIRERQITALHVAAEHGQQDTIRVMLDHSGNALMQDNLINRAMRTAILSFQEGTATALASYAREHVTHDLELLRAAAIGNSEHFLRATLDAAEAADKKLSLDLALEDACRHGHSTAMKFLLSRSDRHELEFRSGAFFWAARQGHSQILNMLFQVCRENELVNALAGAASAGSAVAAEVLDTISAIAQRQISVEDLSNFATTVEETDSHSYSTNQNTGKLSRQRSRTPDTDLVARPWHQGYCRLREDLKRACENGIVKDVIRLVHLYKRLVGGKLDVTFGQCVAAAARFDQPGILAYLLNIDSSYLPVDRVVHLGFLSNFQILLNHGWNVNQALNRLRPPPLGLKIENEHLVKWLLDNGADPNARCDWDVTPLSYAVLKAPWTTIRLLIERGGDTRKGQLLHIAAQRKIEDAFQVLDWLLTHGLSTRVIRYASDARSWIENKKFGMGTPLHVAAERGQANIVSFLLENGADPGIPDIAGRFAPELATQRNGHLLIF